MEIPVQNCRLIAIPVEGDSFLPGEGYAYFKITDPTKIKDIEISDQFKASAYTEFARLTPDERSTLLIATMLTLLEITKEAKSEI